MSSFQKYLEEALAKVDFSQSIEEPEFDYDIVNEVSELIYNARISQDISLNELSQKTGLSQENIMNIESGRTVADILVLKRLADGLGRRLIIDFIDEEFE